MRITHHRCPECGAYLHVRSSGYARCPRGHGAMLVEPLERLDATPNARVVATAQKRTRSEGNC